MNHIQTLHYIPWYMHSLFALCLVRVMFEAIWFSEFIGPLRCGRNFKTVILNINLWIEILSPLMISQHLLRRATCCYLKQCWSRSLRPYEITLPQCGLKGICVLLFRFLNTSLCRIMSFDSFDYWYSIMLIFIFVDLYSKRMINGFQYQIFIFSFTPMTSS